MRYHYVWLIWSSTFVLLWGVLYLADGRRRPVLWRAGLATSVLGLTEPIFVPAYWNPPSLFELAQRTGFDVESLLFCFGIGGIGAVLYDAATRNDLIPMSGLEREHPRHRLHLPALVLPYVIFVPLYFLPWNPIYPSLVCLLVGAASSVVCRPDLRSRTLVGGLLFLGLYSLFMLGLRVSSPGYIEQVWNLRALSGVLVLGIPLEELAFGFAFGAYWTGVYEHLTWHKSARRGASVDGRP